MDLESSAVGAISEASLDGQKMPAALVLGGILKAAAALWLLAYQGAGGVFLHHGKVIFYSYYAILVALVLFGLMEAWAGFWVKQHLSDRRSVGKTIMWISVAPLILVAGLGGFAFVIPK